MNDVLDFATVEAGKLDLVEENFDPSSIISRCVEMVSAQARAHGVKIAIENNNVDLPVLYADERRVRQVLPNLLSNAVKFSPSGGGVVVRPRQLASGEFAINVQDNGPGMTAEEVTVALERFGQVDAGLERRYAGTGVWAAIGEIACRTARRRAVNRERKRTWHNSVNRPTVR